MYCVLVLVVIVSSMLLLDFWYSRFLFAMTNNNKSVDKEKNINLISLSNKISKKATCNNSSKILTEQLIEGSLVIDYEAVRNLDISSMEVFFPFTKDVYVKFMKDVAGKEHYRLLHYLTKIYGDCRHVTDIGTCYVSSALALASGRKYLPVYTFDTPTSSERLVAFRGKTEQEYLKGLHDQKANIKFFNLNLLTVSDEEFSKYHNTWLVMLDTLHLPYSDPFEREWFKRLIGMEKPYQGLILLDDLHLNDEMSRWWNELQEMQSKNKYKCYDLTKIGHNTGTGLLDFSGKIKILQDAIE